MASPHNNNPQYQNGYHLQHISEVAPVTQYDASHGLFGELLDPNLVLEGLQMSDHVGRLDDPTLAAQSQAMHSFLSSSQEEIVIEFDNTTPYKIIVRWIDEKGLCYPHFQWTLQPFESKVQYSRLGHLFVLSILTASQEQLLGAYRIRMPLPSGSPHYILVEPDPTSDEETFHMENILTDTTGRDGMIVASASLDTVSGANHAKSIKTLSTIIHNIRQSPEEPKFRTLRLSNPKVQATIVQCWGARHLLHSVGFRETADTLTLDSLQDDERLKQASQLLDQLQTRCQPHFVAELAPPPPWQGPVLNSTSTHARAFGSGNGTHFLSDDEKWKRAERNHGRRGRAGRRPDPGHAPSSNGAWGR